MPDNPARDDIQDLFLLMRLRSVAREAFGPLELTLYEALVLVNVEAGRTRTKQLVTLLNIQTSAMSIVIRKLSDRGLVFRIKVAEDTRLTDLQLTERGQDVVTEVKQAWMRANSTDEVGATDF